MFVHFPFLRKQNEYYGVAVQHGIRLLPNSEGKNRRDESILLARTLGIGAVNRRIILVRARVDEHVLVFE